MPKIAEYVNEAAGFNPTDRGTEAFAQAGRRAGAFFNQVAETKYAVEATKGRQLDSAIQSAGRVAVDFAEHQEISHGSVAYAGLNDKLTEEWNKRAKAADPNDQTVAAKFREEVLKPELEKFQSAFMTEKGRNFAQSRVSASMNHFFEKTSADMMQKAADAVGVNAVRLQNIQTNTANRDPSSVPQLLKDYDAGLQALVDTNANLKGAVASKLLLQHAQQGRDAIVWAGAVSAVQSSSEPERTAQEWGKKYPEYINGAELQKLAQAARTVQRLNHSQANADRVEQDRIYKRDFNSAANALEASTFDPKTGERVLPKDYARQVLELSKHPGAAQEPGRLKTMIDNMDMLTARMAKGEVAVTDPHVLQDLNRRLALGPGDPNYLKPQELATLNAKGQLSDNHYQKYLGFIKNSELDPAYKIANHQFDQFLQTMKPSITHDTPLNPKGDPEGMQRFGQFQQYAREMFEKVYREKGAAEANRLFDANSPSYLGKVLKYYQRDSKTAIKSFSDYYKSGANLVPGIQVPGDVTNQITNGIEARKPGESAQDYLNRTRRK